MHRTPSLSALALFAFLSTGCGIDLAPPQAPPREAPKDVEARTTPPEPGLTRVVLDANGEKATIADVVESSSAIGTASAGSTMAVVHAHAETVRPVCVAPCVVDLKPGMHVLRFTSDSSEKESEANIEVGDRPKIVRHAMGRRGHWSVGYAGGFVLVLLGATSLGTGGVIYGVDTTNDHHDSPSSVQPLARGWMAAGALMLLGGIPLMLATQPVHQPGATTEVAANK